MPLPRSQPQICISPTNTIPKMKPIPLLLCFLAATAFAAPRKHAPSHTKPKLEEISRFDCVVSFQEMFNEGEWLMRFQKQCWEKYYDIETWTQRQICSTKLYGLTIGIHDKVLPCMIKTCDPRDKKAIVLESRVWWCSFCGWLPDDAEIKC